MKNPNEFAPQSEEQENNNTEKTFANMDWDPWDESKAQEKLQKLHEERLSAEEAKREVLKAFNHQPGQKMFVGSELDGTQKVNTELVVSNMDEKRKQLIENVPDDKKQLDAWIDELNDLPGKYAGNLSNAINENFDEQDEQRLDYLRDRSRKTNYDVNAFIAVNKKHGVDMPSSTREKSYNLLKNHFEEKDNIIGIDRVLDQARRNIVSLEDLPNEDSPQSKVIEEKALEAFEQIAAEHAPELTATEKRKAVENVQKNLRELNHYKRSLEGAKSPNERIKIRNKLGEYMHLKSPSDSKLEEAIYRLEELRDDEDELFEQEKVRKFMYNEAKKERNHVSGFMNSRKLKRPENYLPDSFDEIAGDPTKYSADDLSKLALNYVRMQ